MIKIFNKNKIRPLYRKIDGVIDENDQNNVIESGI